MCLPRGGLRGEEGRELIRRLGLSFTNPGGTCGKWDMCLCFGCGGVGGDGGEWAGGVSQGQGLGWWCYICVCCESGFFCADGRSRYLYVALIGYLRILGAPSVQYCCTLSISASYRLFAYGRYRKSRLVRV